MGAALEDAGVSALWQADAQDVERRRAAARTMAQLMGPPPPQPQAAPPGAEHEADADDDDELLRTQREDTDPPDVAAAAADASDASASAPADEEPRGGAAADAPAPAQQPSMFDWLRHMPQALRGLADDATAGTAALGAGVTLSARGSSTTLATSTSVAERRSNWHGSGVVSV